MNERCDYILCQDNDRNVYANKKVATRITCCFKYDYSMGNQMVTSRVKLGNNHHARFVTILISLSI